MKSPFPLRAALTASTLLALATVTLPAQEAAPHGRRVPLQPFHSAPSPGHHHRAATQAAPVLSGVWKGTFTETDENGRTTETTYRVEADLTLARLNVSPLRSNQAPDGLNVFLQPTTGQGAKPATWDGEALRTTLRDDLRQNGASIRIQKRLSLSPGRDSRHAVFAYEVRVTSEKGRVTKTRELKGSGVLSRVH